VLGGEEGGGGEREREREREREGRGECFCLSLLLLLCDNIITIIPLIQNFAQRIENVAHDKKKINFWISWTWPTPIGAPTQMSLIF
jgi:hypothetical protein